MPEHLQLTRGKSCCITTSASIYYSLHQGYAPSPYLFAPTVDEFIANIWEDVPWHVLFTDN